MDEHAPEALPFGAFHEGSNDRDWMWLFRGSFSVLSVPYHPGRHWARDISEFIPVLKQLRNMHERGFVHGDIRCCNTVFAGANGGHLIDFDLGGNVAGQNPPRFPANYVFHLPDGDRLDRPNAAISTMDDVYAMPQVVLRFHDIQRPPLHFGVGESKPSEDATERANLPQHKQKLEEEIAVLWREKELRTFDVWEDDDPEAAKKRLGDLIAFLTELMSKGWTMCPNPGMLRTMKRWGIDISNEEGVWKDSRQESAHVAEGGLEESRLSRL
jgi:serine/threonine protein kinase